MALSGPGQVEAAIEAVSETPRDPQFDDRLHVRACVLGSAGLVGCGVCSGCGATTSSTHAEHLESMVKHGGLYLNGPHCVLWHCCTNHAVAQCRICTGFFCEEHENDHADICGEAYPRATGMAKLLAPKALGQLRRRKQVREDRCEKRRARFETFVRFFPDSPVAKALAEQQYAGHDAHVRLSMFI